MPIGKKTKAAKQKPVGNSPRDPKNPRNKTKADIQKAYAKEDAQMAKNKMKRGGTAKKKKY
jgi:hypothetical protein